MTGSAHLGEVRPDTRKRSGARLEIGDLGSHRRREARLLNSTLLCKVDLAGNSGGRDKLYLALRNASKKWATVQFWKDALRQFEMIYPGRREAARAAG